ncbi:MAG TPA: lipid II flippase MurJ [Dermatophilaceae bacterium]|nr:lipid II flippase MurJ [Dermatophilaceae bacterium]
MTPRAAGAARAATGVTAAAGLIAALTLLSRVVGFGRTLVFAESVRAGGVGEVYNSVNAVPNVLYEVAAGGVLAAVAVPVVAGHLGRGDAARAHHSASALLTWCLGLLVPLAVLLALVAGPVSRALVGDSGVPGGAALGERMLRVFAVQVPLYGVGVVLGGVLQAHRRFAAVAVAPILSSAVVIGTYLAYGARVDGATSGVPEGAVDLLAWGTTAGVAVLALPLAVPAWRAGFRWRPTWRFPEGDGRRSAALASAGLVALAAQQGAVLATIWVANHRGGGGAFSVYGYIQAVYLLPYAVLAVPVATAAFPALAGGVGARSALGGPAAGPDEQALLGRSLRAVLVLTGLGAAVLLAVAQPVQAFFTALDTRRGGGEVSGPALLALGDGLSAYAPGLVGFGAAALLLRALYVHGRPLHGALVMAAGWAVAALVPLLVLGEGAGPAATLRALGLASSLGMTLAALGLVVLVRRSWGAGTVAGCGRSLAAIVVAAAVALALGDTVARLLPPEGVGGSLLCGAVAGAVAAVAGVAVLAVADPGTVGAVVARGRSRRRGER